MPGSEFWAALLGRRLGSSRFGGMGSLHFPTPFPLPPQDASFLHGHAMTALEQFGGADSDSDSDSWSPPQSAAPRRQLTAAVAPGVAGANSVVALDPSDAGCGGFEVLGRTHGGCLQNLRGRYDTGSDNAGLFDASHRACPALAPGDALFFHPMLAHGSGPNASGRRRRIATLWYVGGHADGEEQEGGDERGEDTLTHTAAGVEAMGRWSGGGEEDVRLRKEAA